MSGSAEYSRQWSISLTIPSESVQEMCGPGVLQQQAIEEQVESLHASVANMSKLYHLLQDRLRVGEKQHGELEAKIGKYQLKMHKMEAELLAAYRGEMNTTCALLEENNQLKEKLQELEEKVKRHKNCYGTYPPT